MTIAEAREKCKSVLKKIPRDALVVGVLVLISLMSFLLGFLAGQDVAVPVPDVAGALSEPAETKGQGDAPNEKATSGAGRYVASKNGTKYYLPSCSGAERISEANKVWFASAAEAVAAGYAPAANCPGL